MVLVVDDDTRVREAIVELLECSGYEVLASADGAGASEVLRNRSVDLDAAVVDHKLPDMMGTEVVETAHRHRPGLPILYASGHGEGNDAFGSVLSRSPTLFVGKPFDIDEVDEKLQALLR